MPAATAIIAGASLAAGIGGQVLSAKAAKKQAKKEAAAQLAQQEAAQLAASNESALSQSNSIEDITPEFTLGAPGAAESLFVSNRRKAAASSTPATGKTVGGL